MIPRMPRGAIPSPRSDIAASEPYQPQPGAEVFVPSGEFPTPNYELAAAQPYRGDSNAPESFLTWPVRMVSLEAERAIGSMWAEEAFAKACAEPRVFLPDDVVGSASNKCGSMNFAEFLQTHGFHIGNEVYLDGPFHSVSWTNEAALSSAISNVGPVKIGIATVNLPAGTQGTVTPGSSGWAIHGLPPAQPGDHCASLCGYGQLAALVDLFKHHDVEVNLPPGMPVGLCYAMFLRGSIGIVDRQSLLNITGEAWLRSPTTIVKTLQANTGKP